MNETVMTIAGNVTDDLQLRYTNSGAPWSTFRVASTPRRFDRAQEKWVDGQPVFMTVTVWRALALNAVASLRKGQPVVVTGRFQQREYEVNEIKRIAYAIEATALGHDLSRGVSTYEKRTHALATSVATDDDGNPANEGLRFLPPEDLAAAAGLGTAEEHVPDAAEELAWA